jgi:two-component system sensor histidine kinase UhpB
MTTQSLSRITTERRVRQPERAPSPRRGASLYLRVVAVNAAVLLAAVVALVLTPITVSSPVAAEQGLVLAVGVAAMVIADAALLRGSFSGLHGLVQRMRTLDLLRPEERLAETGTPEVRALIAGFNAMLDRLEAERRESTRQTLVALEGERRRIGLELHDEIGQRLTGILLQLGRISDEAPEHLGQRIAGIQEEGRATLDEVGALAWQLRPSVLDDLGLVSALDSLVDSFDEHPGWAVRAERPPAPLPPMAADVELAVYRIAQEAITNALRHSGAATVTLRLTVLPGSLSMQVTDDGRGLPSSVREGPGMRGMRERALLIGGRLRIDGASGSGVLVGLDVPRERLLG